MQHQMPECYLDCSNDEPGLTLTVLRQDQILSLKLLYGEKVNIIIIFILNLLQSQVSKLVEAFKQMSE